MSSVWQTGLGKIRFQYPILRHRMMIRREFTSLVFRPIRSALNGPRVELNRKQKSQFQWTLFQEFLMQRKASRLGGGRGETPKCRVTLCVISQEASRPAFSTRDPSQSRGIAYDPSCIHKIIKCKSLPWKTVEPGIESDPGVSQIAEAVADGTVCAEETAPVTWNSSGSVCEASILFCDFYHEYWTFIKLGGCGRRVSWLLLLSCWDVLSYSSMRNFPSTF